MIRRLWLLACFASLVIAWEHVSPQELETGLKEHDVAIVAFVSPSEEKSKALEIEWTLAAPEAKVPFLSIDCASHASACEQHDASSYPSVKLFSKGVVQSTYMGPRRASALLVWIGRAQRQAVSEVDAESLNAFKSIDETVFIAFLDAADEPPRLAFADAASRFRDEFTFGVVVDADALASEGLEAPVVKCYKSIDGDTQFHRGSLDLEALEVFVKEASRPVIGELLPHNHQRFLDRGWPMIYIFGNTEAQRNELRNSLKKMARGQYDALTMVTVDPLEFPDLQEKLGLELGVFPSGAVHRLSKNRIYPYPKGLPVTPNALQKWGLDVLQGRVKPWAPPGTTPTEAAAGDETPGRIQATRKVSMKNFPGVKINIGRDEL